MPVALNTTYSLTPSNTTVVEANTSITFTITRSGDKPAETIYASTLFDTAKSPGDYDGLVNLAVTFSSGQTSRTFTVGINDDSLVEGTEHFRVMIAHNLTDQSAQAVDISDIQIQDNDSIAPAQYSLTPSSTTKVEGDTSITFTITRSGAFPAETIYASTLFDTAKSPGDYDGLVNKAISFSSGETSATFTVHINDDSEVEGTEHFRVMIAHNTGDQSAQALDISDIFITDNDAAAPTFTIGNAGTVTEGSNAAFLVTMNGTISAPITIWYSTFSGTASAAAGDYPGTFVNQPLTFAPGGSTTQTITIPILVETPNSPENAETFTVGLQHTETGAAFTTGSATIAANGSGGPTFTIGNAGTVAEGSNAVFLVTMNGTITAPVTIWYSTFSGTASAAAGDYPVTFVDQPLIFNPGDPNTKQIIIPTLVENPNLPENAETFTVGLQSSQHGSAYTTGSATIAANGSTQNTTYTLSPSSTSVTEGGQVVFTITRAGDKLGETLYFSTLADGTATFAEGDYATATGAKPENIAVVFGAGDTFKTVALNVLQDNVSDSGERFRVILQHDPHDAVSVYVARSDYVTINDPSHSEPIADTDWLSGLTEYMPSLVNVAHASDSTIHLVGFRYPVGATGVVTEASDGDGWSISQDLGTRYDSPNPDHASEKFYHLGEDWNKDGGDFGEPAFAVYSGVVVFSQIGHPGFGNVVVIKHTLPNGSIVYSLYAHLDSIDSKILSDPMVTSGQRVGAIGHSGPPNTPNHLHFELFSIGAGTSLDDYLVSGLNGEWGYSHNDSNTFSERPGSITDYVSYSEDGFTWYNPSIFIDRHKDFVVASSPDTDTTTNIFARGSDAVLGFLEQSKEIVLSWFEEIRVIGGDAIDRLTIGSLFGTTIEQHTIYFDGGAGDDIVDGSQADHRIVAQGGSDNDNLIGGADNDELDGGDGADRMDGGHGADTLTGGTGDDLYFLDNAGDVVVEAVNGGSDTVYTTVSYALLAGQEVEYLAARTTADTTAINLTGNEFANQLFGNDGVNLLDGSAGADVMVGFGGNDIYYVDNAGDQVYEAAGAGTDTIYATVSYTLVESQEVEYLSTRTTADTAAINLTGNALNNQLFGNAGGNILDGAIGADVMNGFGGNDIYYVDNAGDQVYEAVGGGTDTIYTTTSYALVASQEVEYLAARTTADTAAINLTGNALNNQLFGNAGVNLLDGAVGADVLVGFGGNDTYYVDNAGDQVYEAVGGGTDTVYATTSYALVASQEVEYLAARTTADTAAINLTGNTLNNQLFGNAGANLLDGAVGADVMVGFGGNDTYYVDNAGDQVYEAVGGGTDTVYATASYALVESQEVENLSARLTGDTTSINLTGNSLNNTIFGNAGANMLDGKGGNDQLEGGAGTDIFAFTTTLGAGNVDVIYNFLHGADKVALDDAVFTAIGGLGMLNANAFFAGTAAHDADDRIIYNSATGQLFYDADGSGAGAAVQFATVATGLPLTATDFQVI